MDSTLLRHRTVCSATARHVSFADADEFCVPFSRPTTDELCSFFWLVLHVQFTISLQLNE